MSSQYCLECLLFPPVRQTEGRSLAGAEWKSPRVHGHHGTGDITGVTRLADQGIGLLGPSAQIGAVGCRGAPPQNARVVVMLLCNSSRAGEARRFVETRG